MCSLLIVNITVNSTTLQDCWATVCKTVRPMLSDRCVSCLSYLFVTSVYCGQTVGRIGMPLDADVGLGLGHIVRLGPSSPPNGTASPIFGPCLLWPNGRPSLQLLSSFMARCDSGK